eukprot:s2487_g3.t1
MILCQSSPSVEVFTAKVKLVAGATSREIFLVLPLAALGLGRAPAVPSEAPSQAIFCCICACTFAASSVVMPVAFDFAIALGHGAVLSGFLLSGGALGGALGLLAGMGCVTDAAWDQPTARRLCVWAGLLTSAIQLLEACVAQSALAPSDSGGLWVLLGLRQGEAFAAAFALTPALGMLRRITGDSTMLVQCARCLGTAAGPALLLLLPSAGLPQALAVAALVSLAGAGLASLVLPQALPAVAPPAQMELEMDAGSRKQLFTEMSRFFLVRPFVTAGAEAATMMILEVGYSWPAVASGLSLSLASLAALLLSSLGAADSPARESSVFLTCSALALLGCSLLFDLKALGATGLLVGDALLQGTAAPATAIAERWAKRAAAPNSSWSPEAFHLTALLSSSASRFFAPPLVRSLLAGRGLLRRGPQSVRLRAASASHCGGLSCCTKLQTHVAHPWALNRGLGSHLYFSNGCAITDWQANPWWSVDLEAIIPMADNRDFTMTGIQVRAGLRNTWENNPACSSGVILQTVGVTAVNCFAGARYVFIGAPNTERARLSICEIDVVMRGPKEVKTYTGAIGRPLNIRVQGLGFLQQEVWGLAVRQDRIRVVHEAVLCGTAEAYDMDSNLVERSKPYGAPVVEDDNENEVWEGVEFLTMGFYKVCWCSGMFSCDQGTDFTFIVGFAVITGEMRTVAGDGDAPAVVRRHIYIVGSALYCSRIGAIWGLALSDDGETIYFSEPHRVRQANLVNGSVRTRLWV